METAARVFAPSSNTVIGTFFNLGLKITLLKRPSQDSHPGLKLDLLSPQTASEVSRPLVIRHFEEVQSSKDPQPMPAFGFLEELPNRTIPHNTASNLTQVSYAQSNKHACEHYGHPL